MRFRSSDTVSSSDAHILGDLGRAHLRDPQPGGDALRLARGDALGEHLGHGSYHGPAGAASALDWAVGESAPHPDLGDPHADGTDAGDERAFPVAVAEDPLLPVHDVGLGAHDLVDERFGHGPYGLPHIDHPVVGSGHLGQGEGDFG